MSKPTLRQRCIVALVALAVIATSLLGSATNAHASSTWKSAGEQILTIPKGAGSNADVERFVNDLTGALKATPKGAIVRAATYRMSDPKIAKAFLTASDNGATVRITTWQEDYKDNKKLYAKLIKKLGWYSKAKEAKLKADLDANVSYVRKVQGSPYISGKDKYSQHAKGVTITIANTPDGPQQYVTFLSSGNFSKAASSKSWNFTDVFVGSKKIHDGVADYFDGMRFDRTKTSFKPVRDGDVTIRFYPGGDDPVRDALASTKSCKAGKGYGVNGHTQFIVVSYIWTMKMVKEAKDLARLYGLGCVVKVVVDWWPTKNGKQSHTSDGIVKILKEAGIPLATSHVKGWYSHAKLFAASGRVGSDSTVNVVESGSTNLTWSARKRNSEIGVERRTKRAVEFAFDAFDKIWKKSKRMN